MIIGELETTAIIDDPSPARLHDPPLTECKLVLHAGSMRIWKILQKKIIKNKKGIYSDIV